MQNVVGVNYARLFNALTHFQAVSPTQSTAAHYYSASQNFYQALRSIASSYDGRETTETALLAVLDAVPDKEKYTAATLIADENILKNNSLHTKIIEKAFQSIEHVPKDEQYYAFRWIWNNSRTNISLKTNALEQAFNSIKDIKENHIYRESTFVFNNAPEGSPLKMKALETAFDFIDASNQDEENDKSWIWKTIPKSDSPLYENIETLLLNNIKKLEPDQQYSIARSIISNTLEEDSPIRLKAIEIVWNSTIEKLDICQHYDATQWVWKNIPEDNPIKAEAMEKLIGFIESFDPPPQYRDHSWNQYNAALWVKANIPEGKPVHEKITAIISKQETITEESEILAQGALGYTQFISQLNTLKL